MALVYGVNVTTVCLGIEFETKVPNGAEKMDELWGCSIQFHALNLSPLSVGVLAISMDCAQTNSATALEDAYLTNRESVNFNMHSRGNHHCVLLCNNGTTRFCNTVVCSTAHIIYQT